MKDKESTVHRMNVNMHALGSCDGKKDVQFSFIYFAQFKKILIVIHTLF